MPRTSPSSTPASPADSSAPDEPPPGGLCEIHQPNFFPRLSTLAKIFAADYWIALDDLQFARRDYQHRARLGSTSDPVRHQWLSIPTHLPRGRSTLVGEAVLVDPERSRRRVMLMLAQHYGDCPDWPLFRHELESVLLQFRRAGRTVDVAEESTRILLPWVEAPRSAQQPAPRSAGPITASRRSHRHHWRGRLPLWLWRHATEQLRGVASRRTVTTGSV
ncbi:WbqC family protein [Streptomyces roseicoloratus]|nr:WbqC family protein [Streptomyces roseicoloratus]